MSIMEKIFPPMKVTAEDVKAAAEIVRRGLEAEIARLNNLPAGTVVQAGANEPPFLAAAAIKTQRGWLMAYPAALAGEQLARLHPLNEEGIDYNLPLMEGEVDGWRWALVQRLASPVWEEGPLEEPLADRLQAATRAYISNMGACPYCYALNCEGAWEGGVCCWEGGNPIYPIL